jgi:hypothetical protein
MHSEAILGARVELGARHRAPEERPTSAALHGLMTNFFVAYARCIAPRA